jgi:beta-lactamase regulating signal transducer with metallopeptidase domain
MIDHWSDLVGFSDDTCLRCATTLVHFLWQGTVIGLVALITNGSLRRRSAASRYLLNTIALFSMPACVALTFLWISVSGSYLPASRASIGLPAEAPRESASITAIKDGSLSAAPVVAQPSSSATPGAGWTNPQTRSEPTWLHTPRVALEAAARPLSIIYFLGVSILLLRLAAGVCGGHRLRSAARQLSDPTILRIIADQARKIGLRVVPLVGYCERIAVPTVVGLLKPIVLLPVRVAGLDPDHLAVVISHELAHIRRHDLVLNLVQRVIESLLFFHPATWYISRRMSSEREMCCDDLVVASGKERLRYAEALLEMASLCLVETPLGAGQLAAAGNSSSEFALRIERLMEDRPRTRLRLSRSGLCVMIASIVLMLAALSGFPTSADEPSSNAPGAVLTAQKPQRNKDSTPSDKQTTAADADANAAAAAPHTVSVLCVGANGKPVEGAEVHLYQGVRQAGVAHYLHFGPLKSDAQGQVQFPQALFVNSLGNFDRWVYARVPGKLVGVGRSARWIIQRDIVNPDARVQMMPSRSIEGHVTVSEGFDPRTVTVKVRTMDIATGDGDFALQSFPRQDNFRGLDTALPQYFESNPDKDGRFRLNDVPVRGHLYLVTSGKGLGEAQWRNDWQSRAFDKPIEIKVEKERKLVGRVVSPTGEPVGGAEVRARISILWRPSVMYLSTFQAVCDDAGRFQISGLPVVRLVVSATDPNHRWVFRPLEGIEGTEENGRELNLKMENAVELSGTVADSDGNPVEGAAISALADTQEGPGLDDNSTDQHGRYHLRVPAGGAHLYFNALPDGFEYPDPQIIKRVKISAEQPAIKDLNFTLKRQSAKKR